MAENDPILLYSSTPTLHKKRRERTMAELIDLEGIEEKIQLMKETAQELKEMGKSIPAMDRNLLRILASIKMLEINISDVLDPEV